MLAAIEDLLDSWPGTLLVVSHDRYLIERVTDRQFAILDGHLRDLPRGVEQYLELRRATDAARSSVFETRPASPGAPQPATLAGAERRAAEKEISSIDRRLEKLAGEIARVHERLAVHHQGDYVGLGVLGDELRALEASVAELETRWLEVSETLEG
jgi:ATPase subunit of ABC transporter with duplicated ATPase domains